jgi:two-component system, chemotaxis family, CheB/CheR fusion protein
VLRSSFARFRSGPVAPYVLAVSSAGLAYTLTSLLRPVFESIPYMLFWAAVTLTASNGGLGPGLLAVLLSIFAVHYFLTGSVDDWSPLYLLHSLIFVLLAALVSLDRERRRRVEQHLGETKEQLELMMQSARDYAIFSLDLQGRVTVWSEGAERMFGHTRAEIIGKPGAIIYTEEDRASQIPEKERLTALDTGGSQNERWHQRKDGSRIYCSGMVRTMNRGGRPVGFMKIARDMTEAKLLEEEREQLLEREQAARAEAERANRLILRFVAVVSHELRSPLSVIKGFASTLLAQDVTWDPDDQRTFIHKIDGEADRLRELTDQLLDYTRLETSTFPVSPVARHLEDVLEEAMPQLHAITHEHELVVEPVHRVPLVQVDVRRIAQVLVNLVGNAARYAPPRSSITIANHLEGSFLRVDVLDEGPGIPPDQHEIIFEAFEQLGVHSEEERKGAGLGLAIARGIIEAHGGRIGVADGAGKGTTISFTLPLAPATNTAPFPDNLGAPPQ